ncbi:ArsR/SmtB family transcription factor [Chitinophaga alhagiae]|uniref:ArsR/SmtB family transcription factor n=1 Tax=Chitinophaga alhagiae TaxID=2203219 RepID=UPI000E5B6FD6|nr:metalloregulator ArsR/SmtB family transcription factor [Chitinophaga alhagiae]
MEGNTCIRRFADQAQIMACKGRLIAAQKAFTSLSAVLSLTGNEVRLKILYLLEEEKELCPCDLSDILEMTIPAISQHLKKLKDGGIVQTRKEGLTVYYSLVKEFLPTIKPFFTHINSETLKMVEP